LDKLIENQLKDDGRRKKFLVEASNNNQKENMLERLRGLTNFTSGKLACNGHYCLTDNELLGLVVEKQKEKDKKKAEAVDRKLE
jgi:hypothetical protein